MTSEQNVPPLPQENTAHSCPSGSGTENRLRRRSALALAGAAAGAAIVGTSPSATTAAHASPVGSGILTPTAPRPDADPRESLFGAFLTDVHIDAAPRKQDDNLRTVLAHLAEHNADLVLHGGDITEFGSAREYERYAEIVPGTLENRIEHVAGNHETRWDPSATALYRERFHTGTRSFDHQGVHVIMLEAAVALQEEAHVDSALLEWLRRDLKAAKDTPSIVVMHCPPGGDNYYVRGMDHMFQLFAKHPVRLVLAGHVHYDTVTRVNGIHVATVRAIKNEPTYTLLTRVHGSGPGGCDQLRLDVHALAPDDGKPELTHLALIDLDATCGEDSPTHLSSVRGRLHRGTVRVNARTRRYRAAKEAHAQVWDENLYGRHDKSVWQSLEVHGRRLRGDLPMHGVLPGHHRLRVRAVDADGGFWEDATEFSVGGGPVRETDCLRLDGAVQGALATIASDRVLVATNRGQLSLVRLRRGRLRELWSTRIGPVHRGAAIDAERGLAYVPSADHCLYAVHLDDGSIRHRTWLPHPIASTPLLIEDRGEKSIIVAAGNRLARIDEEGRIQWDVPIPQQSTGRPALIDDTLVVGVGDGTVRGYALGDGAEKWSFNTTDKTGDYRRLLYGPWNCVVRDLGNGAALVGTVAAMFAVDAASGAARWEAKVSAMYSPPILLEDGRILAVQENKKPMLIDPGTGATKGIGDDGLISLDAGPVAVPGTALALHVSHGGILTVIDTARPSMRRLRQIGTARVHSTPALINQGRTLIVGDQDGLLRALDVSAVR